MHQPTPDQLFNPNININGFVNTSTPTYVAVANYTPTRACFLAMHARLSPQTKAGRGTHCIYPVSLNISEWLDVLEHTHMHAPHPGMVGMYV